MRVLSLVTFCLAFLLQLTILSPVLAADVLFICGNHIPHHTAKNIEEAKKLSVKEGCKKWDVELADKKMMAIDLKKDYLMKLESALAKGDGKSTDDSSKAEPKIK